MSRNARNGENGESGEKPPNAIARGAPCKEEKLTKMANLTKMLNWTKKSGKNLLWGWQILKLDAKSGPLDSGDFDKKKANMAKICQSLNLSTVS